MPNQSDPNQPTASNPPAVAPPMDLPPLPQEFPGAQQNTQPPPLPTSSVDQGSAAPPETPPVTSNTPKKKFGAGRIIATILGILVLVGGIGTGIVLVSQPKIFFSFAGKSCEDYGSAALRNACLANQSGGDTGTSTTSTSTGVTTPGQFGYVYSQTGDHGQAYIAGTYIADNGQRYLVGGSGANDTLKAAADYCDTHSCSTSTSGLGFSQTALDQITTFQQTGNTGSNLGPINCSQVSWASGISQTVTEPCAGGGYLIEKTNGSVWCTSDNSNCTGTPPEHPSETTNTTAPACLNVTAYSSTWTALTTTELSALTADTAVNFCVTGGGPGNFDQADIKINTTASGPITTKGQGAAAAAFCQGYTITAADIGTTVKVQARIHDSTSNTWVGETF